MYHRLISAVTFATRVSILTCHCRWTIARDRFCGSPPHCYKLCDFNSLHFRLLSFFQLAVFAVSSSKRFVLALNCLKASLGVFNFSATDRSWSESFMLCIFNSCRELHFIYFFFLVFCGVRFNVCVFCCLGDVPVFWLLRCLLMVVNYCACQ